MIGKFLQTQYPSEEGKSKVGSKHREDVERRLAAFLAFTGDLAVRDIIRDHLKAYRNVLETPSCIFGGNHGMTVWTSSLAG